MQQIKKYTTPNTEVFALRPDEHLMDWPLAPSRDDNPAPARFPESEW